MITKNSKRITVAVVLLSSLLLIILSVIQSTSAATDAAANEWTTPHQPVSANGGRKPVIRSSPASNSSRILLVYDQWQNGTGTGTSNKDPFYSISNDNGTTWSTGQLIADGGGSSSDQTVGLLDYQDNAFAFWIETISGSSHLVYSKKPVNSAWSAAQNIATGILLADPNATVDSNNTIHLVWSDTNDIYYSRLPQNGTWLAPIRIANTLPPSLVPDIATADNGDLHIVWQEDTLSGTEIRYSAGVISGNQFIPHTNADEVKLSADAYAQATLPVINIAGSRMQIAYTHKESPEQQNVNFSSCTLPCTGLGKNSFQPITSFVGVDNADPTDLTANLAYARQKNISFIYYHGIKAPGFYEAILGVNSGNGWSAREQVTDPEDFRGIEPSITFNEKTSTLHLAYDREIDEVHRIYVTQKLIPSLVYLPAILKK